MNLHKARQSWHSSAECYSPVGENLLFVLYEHYIQSVHVDKMEYQMMIQWPQKSSWTMNFIELNNIFCLEGCLCLSLK